MLAGSVSLRIEKPLTFSHAPKLAEMDFVVFKSNVVHIFGDSIGPRPKFRAEVIGRIAALHRIGQPMEVAGAVVFLASSAASLITGHTILIDGGWTAR
jgi:NAD(P)-dependent dehydrogenase (short-subunit alcohol dehydrogenase family)